MGKAHKNVGAVVMIFVLVIGIAECRKLKEDELVDGFGASGLGAVGGEGASLGGSGAGVGASGIAGGAVGRSFGDGSGLGFSSAGSVVAVSEPAGQGFTGATAGDGSGLGFSSAGSVVAVSEPAGQGFTGATAGGGI